MIGEEITATTAMTVTFGKAVDESIGLTDSEPLGRRFSYPSISESIVAADDPTFAFSFTLTDIIFIYDVLIHGWKETTTESLVLTDSLAEVLGVMISDWITLVDSQSNNWNGREIVNQSINLYDIAEKHLAVSDTITEDLTVTDAATWLLTVAVLESLGFTDLANAMRTSYLSVSDSAVLTDSPENAWQEIINEVLQAVDVSSVVATFVNVVTESLALSPSATDKLIGFMETLSESLTLSGSVSDKLIGFMETISEALVLSGSASVRNYLSRSISESLILTETITSKGTLYDVIYDTISMNVAVELAGEVYECYVLNTPKFHPSMYSGFNFNSYCVFDNRAFGANGTGIYELTGTTDAGTAISTGAVLSKTDFGSRNYKRFRKGYIGVSGSSPKMVLEGDDGSRQVYDISSEGMVVFSHEQKAREWKLSLAEFETLDVMKLIPVVLRK